MQFYEFYEFKRPNVANRERMRMISKSLNLLPKVLLKCIRNVGLLGIALSLLSNLNERWQRGAYRLGSMILLVLNDHWQDAPEEREIAKETTKELSEKPDRESVLLPISLFRTINEQGVERVERAFAMRAAATVGTVRTHEVGMHEVRMGSNCRITNGGMPTAVESFCRMQTRPRSRLEIDGKLFENSNIW